MKVQVKRSSSSMDVLLGLEDRLIELTHRIAIHSKAPMPRPSVKKLGANDRLWREKLKGIDKDIRFST